jgi:hypothetical protein
LFAGSDPGGQRAAAIYSLITTAKLNDVDPRAWFANVLARINDHRQGAWTISCPGTGRPPDPKPRPDHVTRGAHRTDTVNTNSHGSEPMRPIAHSD